VLPVEIRSFDDSLRLVLDGELTLRGYPILHNGTPSFSRTDQARVHAELDALRLSPLVAKVKDGHITDLRATAPAGEPAAGCCSRCSTSTPATARCGRSASPTTSAAAARRQHAMNEVYGGLNEGSDGCLHWGLGLTPYTQYHLRHHLAGHPGPDRHRSGRPGLMSRRPAGRDPEGR